MDLEDLVLSRIIPAYESLGPISFAWAQGSLVSGYTTNADYDVILAWDMEALPKERGSLVTELDDRDPDTPDVINHRDVNIDRFVIKGQEFNIGHATAQGFKRHHVEPVLAGVAFRDDDILQPVTAVSGFYYGKVLLDQGGDAAAIRELLGTFPPKLKSEALRSLRAHTKDLGTVQSFGERGDGMIFYRELARLVRLFLLAFFASHDIYYPGDKWVLSSLKRFSIEGAEELWNRIWKEGASPRDRVASARALAELAETRLDP